MTGRTLLIFYGFIPHQEMLLALTVTVSWNFIGLNIYRNTRIILCYSPKLQSGKKYVCFVISKVFVVYEDFVIFISKVKNSHLSVSLASFQNFDQSGHLFWILRFHSIILSIITHAHDLELWNLWSISQWSYNHNVQPWYHHNTTSVYDIGLLT